MGNSASAIRLVNNSVTTQFVGLDPTYSYQRRGQLIKYEHRAMDGKLYTFRVGSWFHFEVPMVMVNSADRSQVNSWWGAGQSLRFYEDVQNFTSSYFLVRIVNEEEPFPQFEPSLYNQMWEGEMILETYS